MNARAWLAAGIVFTAAFGTPRGAAAGNLAGPDIALPGQWSITSDGQSKLTLHPAPGRPTGLEIRYNLNGPGWRWANITATFEGFWRENTPLVFNLKANGEAVLEFKVVDKDGTIFIRRFELKNQYKKWSPIVLYPHNLQYAWGGKDKELGEVSSLQLAVAGNANTGTIFMEGLGWGKPGLPPTFTDRKSWLDPDREKEGLGFIQRRASRSTAEDPRVLEWLKRVQDVSSPEKRLLPSMEDNSAQTFNNALAAMAFILKNERERAERILDFYAAATDRNNGSLTRQNFFYRGEPRGFYQSVQLREGSTPAYHSAGSDRWMGDMAWLLIACKYHERTYASSRYQPLQQLLKDLLLSFFVPASPGGYVQHGWRGNDASKHAGFGHPEGNIDAYAAFKLYGLPQARDIRLWLESVLQGDSLPLDLYTWRVLAFGPEQGALLNTVDYDFRFRKTLTHGNRLVMGVFHGPEGDVNNIWLDGLGHMACAYYYAGNEERGNFYSNQMDSFLLDRYVGGADTRALPYAANSQGGYTWVDFEKGFTSTAVWYIFAKNRFNPFTLTHAPTK